MPEGENIQTTIENRRLRVESSELRFELHREMFGCFPEPNLFDDMEKALENRVRDDFVGLREETVRFGLLSAIRGLNAEIRGTKVGSGEDVVHKGEVSKAIFEIEAGKRSMESEVDVSDIDAEFFMEISRCYSLSEEIMKAKGWDDIRTRKFVSRLASNVFKSGLVEISRERVSLDSLINFFARIQNQAEALIVDQKKVAIEYLLDGLSIDFYKDKLPEVVEDSRQSEEDVARVSRVKESPRYEQVLHTLQTVRENSEFVRADLIPACIKRGDDAQTVFWKIHTGEFRGDPMAAQMLLSGSIAEVFNYVRSRSGESFYNSNVGSPRRIEVASGRFSHILPMYLPQLQTELFGKIDKLDAELSESDFMDIVTVADISMISLHLPFDGSGRTIEDFFVFMGQKYNFPLTVSALGYRTIGSPILEERDEAAVVLKKQINKVVLARLGIVSDPDSDAEALMKVSRMFDCDDSLAEKVFNSEKALFTSQINDAISNPAKRKEVMEMLPASMRLRDNWMEARKSNFFEVPDEYKAEIDSLTALISSTKDIEAQGRKISKFVFDIKEAFAKDGKDIGEVHRRFLAQVGNIESEFNLDLLPEMVRRLEQTIHELDEDLEAEEDNKQFVALFDLVKSRVSGRIVYDEVFKRIDKLKSNGDYQVRSLVGLLEVYALEKVNIQKNRNKDDLLFRAFPKVKCVIEKAAKFGSVVTRLRAGAALKRIKNSAPKFVEWKKPE